MKKLLLALLAWIMMAGVAMGAVNINTASKEQLDSLKGVGPVKAQAIIDYRTKNGPFKTIDDLEKVPGIGPATMKEIRNDITLTGATTTPAKAAEKSADKGKKDEPKATAKKTDEPKAAAKKEMTKRAVKADEKAMKKADEKKKFDDKPAPKKEEGKAAKKGDDKKAVEKRAVEKKDAKKDDARAVDTQDEKKDTKK